MIDKSLGDAADRAKEEACRQQNFEIGACFMEMKPPVSEERKCPWCEFKVSYDYYYHEFICDDQCGWHSQAFKPDVSEDEAWSVVKNNFTTDRMWR